MLFKYKDTNFTKKLLCRSDGIYHLNDIKVGFDNIQQRIGHPITLYNP